MTPVRHKSISIVSILTASMRTVDPELWSRRARLPGVQVTRRTRFGQQRRLGLETRLRDSLQDSVEEFWYTSTHAAAKFYHEDRAERWERWRQVGVVWWSVAVGAAVLVHSYVQVMARPPLVVSLQPDDNRVTDYSFPAAALCSNNVISRAALHNYTRFLYTHHKNKLYRYRESEIEHNLLDLGALLTLALPPIKMGFERFLREVEPDFNITDIMFRLSTNCSAILKRCSWRGQLMDCATLFASRITALGFCCVFNSRYQPEDYGREPAVLDLIGQDYGLGVVIKEEKDDFAYVRRPAYGMELLLFEGGAYPLVESGDVRMYPLPRNASLFFNIRAFSQQPAAELAYYSEERRGCRLEETGEEGGMSRCLWQCRRDTAAALCGCQPYALRPPPGAACTLSELGCLNKHREKFMYLFPGAGAGEALSQELQDALDCPHCRVSCRRQLYSATISYSFYKSKSNNVFRNFLSEGLSLVNSTVIRLFYSIDHQEWYKVEPYTRWYEIIAKLSTLWTFVTGVSILGSAKLVYHCTLRWGHHFLRRSRRHTRPLATSM